MSLQFDIQGDQGRAKQLDQVIQRLKEQEQKYLDLLLKLSVCYPLVLIPNNKSLHGRRQIHVNVVMALCQK